MSGIPEVSGSSPDFSADTYLRPRKRTILPMRSAEVAARRAGAIRLQGILGCSSAVERPAVNRFVAGSIPVAPAKCGTLNEYPVFGWGKGVEHDERF